MRILFTLIFFSLLLSDSTAQRGEFRIGFQASPSFSSMNTNRKDIRGNGTNLGLKLGVIGEYFFAENYSLMSGLTLALNHGGTLQHDPGDNIFIDIWTNSPDVTDEARCLPNKSNFKYGLQYLEIPFALRLRTKEFGYLRYYAEVPYFSLGLNVRARGDVEGAVNLEDEFINKDVNPFNFWWGLGGGVEYSLSENTSLIGGIHFQSSLIDVTRNKGAAYYEAHQGGTTDICIPNNQVAEEDSNGRVNVITIRIGVMF